MKLHIVIEKDEAGYLASLHERWDMKRKPDLSRNDAPRFVLDLAINMAIIFSSDARPGG